MSTATVGYDLLVGPLLIGVILNALAFGVCFMQLVTYALSGFSDRWMIIVLIVWVYAIDTFQVGSSVSMLWKYVVTNFANPQALQSAPWEYASLPIFSALYVYPFSSPSVNLHLLASMQKKLIDCSLFYVYINGSSPVISRGSIIFLSLRKTIRSIN